MALPIPLQKPESSPRSWLFWQWVSAAWFMAPRSSFRPFSFPVYSIATKRKMQLTSKTWPTSLQFFLKRCPFTFTTVMFHFWVSLHVQEIILKQSTTRLKESTNTNELPVIGGKWIKIWLKNSWPNWFIKAFALYL